MWSGWLGSPKATQMSRKNVVRLKETQDIFFKILRWQCIWSTKINPG